MNQPIKRGEIYCADLSPVVGSEQGGVRPVLVLQNDTGNRHSPTTIVAAITGCPTKAELPTHVAVVLLEQIRTLDKSRLGVRLARLDKETMGKIDRALIASFGIKYMEELL